MSFTLEHGESIGRKGTSINAGATMRSVTLYATGACNLRCKHCAVGADQTHPRPELGTDDLKSVVSRLAEAGASYCTILGGEATVFRSDLAEILDHAATVGLAIVINTNLLVYEAVAPLVGKKALKGLIVSLDGASAETHDAMRGRGSFAKTAANIRAVAASDRVKRGELSIDISFVLTKVNMRDAARMVSFAAEVGATRLNAKHVKMIGRAELFSSRLAMSSRELLDAFSELMVSWQLCPTIELDVYLPPAFALYLNRRFGSSFPVDGHPACGGTGEFQYVDLLGNILPCPAMSFEEDRIRGIKAVRENINLLHVSAAAAARTELFQSFDQQRSDRRFQTQMKPCNTCAFNTVCFPCTADFIRTGVHGEVDICNAVKLHADEYLPGFSQKVFPGALVAKGAVSVQSFS